MDNIIMADVPAGFVKLAGGTYTLASDASSMTIPISYSGDAVIVGVGNAALASTAQTGAWIGVRLAPTTISPTIYPVNYLNEYAYKAASSGFYSYQKSSGNTGKLELTSTSIKVYQRDVNYPIRAATYSWEIWGVK